MRSIQLGIKRGIDVIIALLSLALLSPLILVIALAIRLESRGPVLFRQTRVGKGGRLFRLNKFRTMIPGAVNMGTGLTTAKDDSRITRIGRLLRRSSLDELPQLLNVLIGDISLVGPRPTVPEHLEYYGPFERRRLEVKPGITGLAMVRGRNSNPWSVRINYDVEYVERFSLWLDSLILAKTVWVVLSHKDTYYDYEKYGPAFDLVKPNEQDRKKKPAR